MKDTFEKRWGPIKKRETCYFVLFGNKSLFFPTKEVGTTVFENDNQKYHTDFHAKK